MKERRNSSARTISFVMLVTLLGKVMGLYRDRLLAVHYGVSMEANAFFTASRIPRVFFDAVFASAIASCFIPVFSEYLEKKGKEAARRFSIRSPPLTAVPPEAPGRRGTPVNSGPELRIYIIHQGSPFFNRRSGVLQFVYNYPVSGLQAKKDRTYAGAGRSRTCG